MSRLALFFALSLLALSPFASADIPRLISLQGKLTDASDNPVSSSTNFVFRIYNASLGGTLAWNETQNSIVPDSNGIFSALLGSATALNIPFNESYWLEVKVNSEILSPRTRMGSAGYALRSESPWNTTGNNIYTTNAGNVGIGTATPGTKLDVQGGNIQTSGTVTASSFSGAGTGLTGTAGGLTSGSASSVPWSGVTSKPTTIAGYGITDIGSQSVNYATSSGNADTVDGKHANQLGGYTDFTMVSSGDVVGGSGCSATVSCPPALPYLVACLRETCGSGGGSNCGLPDVGLQDADWDAASCTASLGETGYCCAEKCRARALCGAK